MTALPAVLLSPERVSDLIKTIGEKGDGRTRLPGFALLCNTFVQEKQVPDNIHRAFTVARQPFLTIGRTMWHTLNRN
jgi:hypothetical protein